MADDTDLKNKLNNALADDGIKISKDSMKEIEKLDEIVKMESSLSSISADTRHIYNTVKGGSNIQKFLRIISENSSSINSFIGGFQSQPNSSTTDNSQSKSKASNAFSNVNHLGNFSDVFRNIFSEIEKFHSDFVSFAKNSKITAQQDKQEEQSKEKNAEIKETRKERRGGVGNGAKVGGVIQSTVSKVAGGLNLNSATDIASNLLKFIPGVGGIAGGVLQAVKELFNMIAKVDKEASDYARTVGGSTHQKNQIFQTSQRVADNTRALFGINQEEIIKQATETAQAFGRNISHISDKAIEASLMLKKMGIDTQTLGQLDTYGKSIEETDAFMTDLYKRVSKRGLSFKNVSKAVADNLKSAQSYSFQNGLKGLERMAERSTQLKFNMQQALTFADKVSTFEGAIQAGAHLSVLGGTFGQYSNPMQLMYEGLNDVESLQERMIKMFGDKAFWDNEKGQMRINPVDLQIMKAAAEAIGVDKNEMASMALNQGRFNRIEAQINKNLFDNDTIEFIKNLSELDKNGNANITLNGKTKSVKDLTSHDALAISEEAKRMEDERNATMGDIYVSTMGIGEKLDNILKYITTKLGVWVARIAGVNNFSQTADRAAWHMLSSDEKNALIEKYGSRKVAKVAFGMGQEIELSNSKLTREGRLNAEAARGYLNENGSWRAFRRGDRDTNVRDYGIANRLDQKANGIVEGNYHINGGVPALYNGMPVEIEKDETLFGKDVLYRYGSKFLKNIKDHNVPTISNIQGNNLNPISVAPVSPSGAGKISFDTFKVEVGGKIDLTSGNQTRQLDISKLSSTDLDKLTQMIYKQVYNEIARRIEKGYNKETNPFRGA